MTIIGRRDLVPHFRHRKEKRRGKRDPKVMEKYDKRARMLSKLGYASYAEYLASDEWKAIRARVLAARPLCLVCEGKAAVVHHVKYFDTVLLGLDDGPLAPLCHRCHESIEVDANGKKVSLSSANMKLFPLLPLTKSGNDWFIAYRTRRKSVPKGTS